MSRFKKGDVVYYKPKDGNLSNVRSFGLEPGKSVKVKNVTARVQENTPYEVVDFRKDAWLCLSIRLPDGRTPFFDPDDFISENEYLGKDKKDNDEIKKGDTVYFNGRYDSRFLKKGKSYKVSYADKSLIGLENIGGNTYFSKNDFTKDEKESIGIKKGDKVYYIGERDRDLKRKTPYEVNFAGPHVITVVGYGNTFYRTCDFITEEEYLKKINRPKHDFKEGDIVYYDGIEREYEYHVPYLLYGYASNTDDFFGIYVKNVFKPIQRVVVNKKFISKKEYNKKYGVEEPKIIANYMDFVKNFKVGDVVYYMGNKIARLNPDTPYKVEFFNPNTNAIKIDGDICPSTDFISEEDYKKLNNKTFNIGEMKTDTEIRWRIYKDTKSGELKWEKPYAPQDEWFRAIVKLEKPDKAYLRIDVRKTNTWEMEIYYHRNRPPFEADNSGMIIRHFKEGKIVATIARKILEKMREDLKKK